MSKHSDFYREHYQSTVKHLDEITVRKDSRSDWSHIEMRVCGREPKVDITLRSQRMAEHLHFMLGQMLGKN